jgi:hypothetical protein
MRRERHPEVTRCALVVAAAAHLGCSASPEAAPPPQTPRAPKEAQSELSRYFPAPDDTVYAYATVDESSGESGVLMMHVSRPRPGRVDLETGSRVQRLVIAPDRIEYLDGGTLLQSPLSVGARWQGRIGAVVVTEVDTIARVAAGTFTDCVTTREEAAAAAGSRTVVATFCRDVGLVRLDIEAVTDEGLLSQHTELRSFGPRIDLGAPPAATQTRE